jgi:predicted ATPase
MQKRFILTKLKYKRKNGNEIKITFFKKNSNFNFNNLPISIIIGANGTGKSYILRSIVDIFRQLETQLSSDTIEKKKKSDFDYFEIEFINNGKNNEISYKDNVYNGANDLSCLPTRFLASSLMINDKFPYQDNSKVKDTKYRYLGIRSSSNQAGTHTFLKKTVENIVNSANRKNTKDMKIKEIFNFLGFDTNIEIKFKARKIKTFFENDIDSAFLEDYFVNWDKRDNNRKTVPFSYKQYLSLKKENNVDGLETFINKIKAKKNKTHEISYTLNLSNIEKNNLTEDFENLQKLMSLDIISSPSLIVKKDSNTQYNVEEISSGEYNFIFTMMNLMSYIEKNSLILIDEPEISFHPNWQLEYLENLQIIFEKFHSCNVIIATHSHYLISDIKPELSSIIRITNDTIQNINESTYGWSAEDILYNIFNVSTTRNKVIYAKFEEIIKEIQQNKQGDKDFTPYLIELNNIAKNLKISDPLKKVINHINDKYEAVE